MIGIDTWWFARGLATMATARGPHRCRLLPPRSPAMPTGKRCLPCPVSTEHATGTAPKAIESSSGNVHF